jgi:hypothetical protein
VVCRKKDRPDRELEREKKEHKYPFKVVEITPPPRCLGVRCFPTVTTRCPGSFSEFRCLCSLPNPEAAASACGVHQANRTC